MTDGVGGKRETARRPAFALLIALLLIQPVASSCREDSARESTARVRYARVAHQPRVADTSRAFRTLEEVRGGWKQQLREQQQEHLQEERRRMSWYYTSGEEDAAEADIDDGERQRLLRLLRETHWERQSGHSFGEGEIGTDFDVETSAWWNTLEDAAGDAQNSGLVVVMLAPAWNGEALALAREVEALSAANATTRGVDELTSSSSSSSSGAADVHFVWISEDQAVSEARQRMCSRRVLGKGASGASVPEDKRIGSSIVLDGGGVQHNHNHGAPDVGGLRSGQRGSSPAMEEFMHLPLPLVVVLQRSGRRAARRHSEGGDISRFSCHFYGGPWRAWPVVQAVARISHEMARRGEPSTWRDGILMSRPRNTEDMDELRASHDFVAVAYINCGICKKIYRRARAADAVGSDPDALRDDMKACLKECSTFRAAFREAAIYMCLSPTLRFAAVDLGPASRAIPGGAAETLEVTVNEADSAARENSTAAAALVELKKVYYYKRVGFDSAGESIAGAVDVYGDNVADAEMNDLDVFKLSLLSRHGRHFSFMFNNVSPDNLTRELVLWLTSRMTRDVDLVDNNGVSANVASTLTDVLPSLMRGNFDVERRGARAMLPLKPPRRLRSKVNIILFVDRHAPPSLSGLDTVSVIRSMRTVASDFLGDRDDACSPHVSASPETIASPTNRTHASPRSEASVHFLMMNSASPPLKGSFAHWFGIRSLPAIGSVVYEYDADAADAADESETTSGSSAMELEDGPVYVGDATYFALQPRRSTAMGPSSSSATDSDSESGEEREDGGRDAIGGGRLLSRDTIQQFVCAVVDGVAHEHVRRSVEPGGVDHVRDVRVLTSSSFEALLSVNDGARSARAGDGVTVVKVTLVLLHAPYCGFCLRARALFSHLARRQPGASWMPPRGVDVDFASVDCAMEDCRKMLAPSAVEEFPTILLVTRDGSEPLVYEGGLNGSQLLRFVREAATLNSS